MVVMRYAKLLGCVLLAAAAIAGCGPAANDSSGAAAGQKRMIILMNGNSPFWDTMREGMNKAAAELGVNAVLEVNDGTPRGQINKLRQFNTQTDVAAVAISAIDARNQAIADEMRKLRSRGVPVITVDSDVDRDQFADARFAFIGTNNFSGGRELGIAARNLLPEGGGYVTFVGRIGAQNAVERIAGFAEGAGDAFQSLDSMQDENNRVRARENVRNAIGNHPDLKALVGIWSYNAPAIVDVVRELGVRNRFTIVTFDAEPIAIRQMGEGDIDAMVVQDPFDMGYHGVRLMKALVDGDEATIAEMFPDAAADGEHIYDTGLKVVVPDEGSPLRAAMFGETTEFMTLGEFRRWLEQYGLEGS